MMGKLKRLLPIGLTARGGALVGVALLLLIGVAWRLASDPGELRFASDVALIQPLPPDRVRPILPSAPIASPAPLADPVTPAAVDLALVEPSPDGPLPRIAPDGRRPLAAYARPQAPVGDQPQVAILVRGLGLQLDATNAAINLPGAISLHFSGYSDDLAAQFDRARLAGHEVLLDLPMQPADYPASDPGPQTLLVDAPVQANLERLTQILVRAPGYIGLAGEGGAFAASPAAVPILQVLAARGLGLIEIGSGNLALAAAGVRLPYRASAVILDREPSAATIDMTLVALEQSARAKGSALGVAEPFPISLERLVAWIDSLPGKGIALVPASHLLQAPSGEARAAAEPAAPARTPN